MQYTNKTNLINFANLQIADRCIENFDQNSNQLINMFVIQCMLINCHIFLRYLFFLNIILALLRFSFLNKRLHIFLCIQLFSSIVEEVKDDYF